jgi:hypothetical protein
MGKSLHDTAKAILMKEGEIPSVSASDNNPDRDINSKTSNAQTLKPKSKLSEPDPKHDESEDLGGATPTSTAKENLGAKASKSKDKSKSSVSSVAAEPPKKLSEKKKDKDDDDEDADDEDLKEDTYLSEDDMDTLIAELSEKGLSEDEIADYLEENFEVLEEESESEDMELSEEAETFIAAALEEGLSEDEIVDALAEKFDLAEETTQSYQSTAKERALEKLQQESFEIDMNEAINALFEGEELSEDFREKAKTIFESAVNARLTEEVERINTAYTAAVEDEIYEMGHELSEAYDEEIKFIKENVRNYMSYATEQWIVENEVAIDSGLKSELTEDFISGLRNLFAEHYIDIPEDKVSIVEELHAELEKTKVRLNEELERNVSLFNTINESKKNDIILSVSDGLTATQADKLKTLAESIRFSDEDDFATKVATLKESYFPASIGTTNTPIDQAEPLPRGAGILTEDTRMQAYVNVIGKKLPR